MSCSGPGGSATDSVMYRQVRPQGDYDGDGKTDRAVYRASNNTWYVNNTSFVWGQAGDIPVPGDYDGDGKSDIAVYRPANGVWYILFSSSNYSTSATQNYQWGLAGDMPIPGDYDGDGKIDLAVYRPSDGTWWLLLTSTGYSRSAYQTYQWGLVRDLAVPADYDGDGRTDLAVYRPSDGTWWVLFSASHYSRSSYQTQQWGLVGDVPIPADYNGDGKADFAVYRPGNRTWWVYNQIAGKQFGLLSDLPVPGDYDGDGKADLAVYRHASGTWMSLNSKDGAYVSLPVGTRGDLPVVTNIRALPADPYGAHDTSSCTQITGWSCDPDDYNASVTIHFYKDGPAGTGVYVGSTTADSSRVDVSNAGYCGGLSNHGFVYATPTSLMDGTAHTIYAYGLNVGTAGAPYNPILDNSPKSLICMPPTILPVTISSFTANRAFPSYVNQPITWTIAAQGGSGPLQYQFLYQKLGGPWTSNTYSSTNTFTMTPVSTGTYSVQAWVRVVGSTAAYDAWRASGAFDVVFSTPVITSSSTVSAVTGTPFTYRITATNSPTSFSATSLPPGMTVNAGTGLITGTPNTVGVSTVTLSASNSGGTGTRTLSITVNPLASGTVPVTISSLTAISGMPAVVNQPIQWKVTAQGGNGPLQYLFRYQLVGGPWVTGAYGATNTFTMTVKTPGSYVLEAWARVVGSTSAYDASRTAGPFNVIFKVNGVLVPAPFAESEFTWVEDSVPAGASMGSDGGDAWSWGTTTPAPCSGSNAHSSALASGSHQHYFQNAQAPLQVNSGDILFTYIYLDPLNPPTEAMLQWNDGSWEHRAYWGTDDLQLGTNGTASRRRIGALPPAGQWVKLSVPASVVDLEGHSVSGMAYTLYGGKATWDRSGKAAGDPLAASGSNIAPPVARNDLQGLRLFPNPWRADRANNPYITFDHLGTNTTIKIFTVSGHWVKTLPESSTSVTWDLTNDSGDKVASGLYLYLATTDDGQKKRGQVAIVK